MKLPNKKFLIAGFALTVLAQLAIPLKMVYDSEMTASHGTEYKFRTRPIDPSDPFRGKYITLDFESSSVNIDNTDWKYGEEAYVYIKTDAEGFAYVTNMSHQPLDTPNDYFMGKARPVYDGKMNIDFPFDRFYMEEGKAYEAELAYTEYNNDTVARPAYAVVAVKGGNCVLKDVIIDGMPIREYVLKEREKGK
ncbi:GDYXXLXY domain-containing protein [Flavobacterium sp. DGU11]|uniref:GDYXXLXY domain-containing protein n=1 Tax=Flavobacterium arundinis TaxID=3139143 RepID=A0ABU9I2M9_9FLAO